MPGNVTLNNVTPNTVMPGLTRHLQPKGLRVRPAMTEGSYNANDSRIFYNQGRSLRAGL